MVKPSWEAKILAVLFFGPPIIVAFAVYGPWKFDWLPQADFPYGERYEPTRILPEIPLEIDGGGFLQANWAIGRWSVIYGNTSNCDFICMRNLNVLMELKEKASNQSVVVQSIYLHAGENITSIQSLKLSEELIVGRIDGSKALPLRRALDENLLAEGWFYITDPSGRLIFNYPSDADQQGVLRDLKRLIALDQLV
ncbi:MAG: hypothetical protein CMM56_03940 [Rhodospirillaceae bacterium]|nr:hypothetical protein [Rhodospirillaceae bacterium]